MQKAAYRAYGARTCLLKLIETSADQGTAG